VTARIGIAVALAAICFAVYAPVLGNGFVWDDEQYVVHHPRVSGGLGLANAAGLRLLRRRELPSAHVALAHGGRVIFGLDPRGHHLVRTSVPPRDEHGPGLPAPDRAHECGSRERAGRRALRRPSSEASRRWPGSPSARHAPFDRALPQGAPGVDGVGAAPSTGATPWSSRAVPLAALASKAMPVTFPLQLLLLDWWPLRRTMKSRRAPRAREALLPPRRGLRRPRARRAGPRRRGREHPLPARLENAATSCLAYLGAAFRPTRLGVFYPFPAEPSRSASGSERSRSSWRSARARSLARQALPRWRSARPGSWSRCFRSSESCGWECNPGADRYAYVPLLGAFIAVVWSARALAARVRAARPVLAAAAVVVRS
jgi:hypothetical protein